MRAIILCAGESVRWGNYLDGPKQLAPVGSENVLGRTIRLLQERGVASPFVVSNDRRLAIPGSKFFSPQSYRWTADTFLSTRELWTKDFTIVLLGDVWFSNGAIDIICRPSNSVKFFGRTGWSRYSGSRYPELFAFSFPSVSNVEMERHARLVVRDAVENNGKAKIWQLYRSFAGIPLDDSWFDRSLFKIIDDATEDFDTPEDYDRWINVYRRLHSDELFVRVFAKIMIKIRYPQNILSRYIGRRHWYRFKKWVLRRTTMRST